MTVAEEKERRDFDRVLTSEARRFRIDSDEEEEEEGDDEVEEEDQGPRRMEAPRSGGNSARSNPPWATHDEFPERVPSRKGSANGSGFRKTAWT